MRKMDYLLFSRQNDGLGADDAMLQLPDGLEIRVTRIGFGIVRFLKKQISSAELLFSLASFGRCYLYTAVTRDGAVVHKSTVIGKNFKFPFLKRGEYEIGPCHTVEAYRGRGIYPCVLRRIVSSFSPRTSFYMLVREDNAASISGIRKAGFQLIGQLQKKRGRWYTI